MENNVIYTLDNINKIQKEVSVLSLSLLIGHNTRPRYMLNNEVRFTLSNGMTIIIPEGFVYDKSSVPRFLWGLLPNDGDMEIGTIIHDFLYVYKPFGTHKRQRKFADDEMYLWSKRISGTASKWSWRNLDNWVRWKAVRLFGWIVWNKNK